MRCLRQHFFPFRMCLQIVFLQWSQRHSSLCCVVNVKRQLTSMDVHVFITSIPLPPPHEQTWTNYKYFSLLMSLLPPTYKHELVHNISCCDARSPCIRDMPRPHDYGMIIYNARNTRAMLFWAPRNKILGQYFTYYAQMLVYKCKCWMHMKKYLQRQWTRMQSMYNVYLAS